MNHYHDYVALCLRQVLDGDCVVNEYTYHAYMAFSVFGNITTREARNLSYGLLFSNNVFTVQSIVDSIWHYRPFNSLEHCVCTSVINNIRTNQDECPLPQHAVSKLFHSLRRWPNIEKALGECLVFAGRVP